MRGTMLIYRPHERRPTVRQIERALTRDEVKAVIGGGYLEQVAGFKSVAYDNAIEDCIALCDKDAKAKGFAVNNAATNAWDRALRRTGFDDGLLRANGLLADWLAGPVVVLFGDNEFMEAL
jgi:hypothetical protein